MNTTDWLEIETEWRHALVDHLVATARLTSAFAEPLGAAEIGHYLGLWHDLGKFDPAWQDYLIKAEAGQIAPGHGPDHKAAGTSIAAPMLGPLALVIHGHHGGLKSASDLRQWLPDHVSRPGVAEAIRRARATMPDIDPPARLVPEQAHGRRALFRLGRPQPPGQGQGHRVGSQVLAGLADDVGVAVGEAHRRHQPGFCHRAGVSPCPGEIDGARRLADELIAASLEALTPFGRRAETLAEERSGDGRSVVEPPLAQICGVFLNAIFLDHLDADYDHLVRMNELITAYGAEAPHTASTAVSVSEPMRTITPMIVTYM